MKIIKSKINIVKGTVLMAVLIIFDQITKLLAKANLQNKPDFVIIPGVFELHYLENQSAAFGVDLISIIQNVFKFEYFIQNPDAFLKTKMIFFAIITSIVVVLLYLLYLRIPDEKRFQPISWILIFFIAGAVGNLIDRVVLNYVVDFFYFSLINFPVFNVADIYVTVTAFFIIVLGLFYYKEADYDRIFPSKKKKSENNKSSEDNK